MPLPRARHASRSNHAVRMLPDQPEPLEQLESRRLLSTTYDISGVGSASLDQPQIHAIFRNSPTGDPLGGTGPDDGYSLTAFLDTGTSANLISQESADALGLTPSTFNGQPVQFTDIGVGGGQVFDVSDPVYGAMAPVRSLFDGDLPVEDFNQNFGPVRVEINQSAADDLLGPLEIIGMPALKGKVMVMDPRPLNQTDPDLLDGMKTYVYAPNTPFDAANEQTDPGIPLANLHVKLSNANFSRFTETTPAGAPGPTFTPNPIIGSDPTGSGGGSAPGVGVTEGNFSATGNFLFDTGAAASFISTALAAKLHVHYKPGTFDTDNPVLVDDSGNPLPNQFSLPLGGVGGTINAAGFHLSSLSLPTMEGTPVRFLDAPVLVADVTVQDPKTSQQITLDGDFGMNFLVASIDVNGSDLGNSSAGAFDWITYDQPAGILGLFLPDAGPGHLPPPVGQSIVGTVYNDLNASSTPDAGEPGLAGWQVYLDNNKNGKPDPGEPTTKTGSDGSYSFTGLSTGVSYRVRESAPTGSTGWKQSQPAAGYYDVTLSSGQQAEKDLGNYQLGKVAGTVYNDADANGSRGSKESSLGSWTAWLDLNHNGKLDSTDPKATTNSAGAYTISNVKPGAYKVYLQPKTGWRQTQPAGGSAVGNAATVVSGQTTAGQDFGVTQRAFISGTVFLDKNGSKKQDAGESGLGGWVVFIDANGNKKRDATERFATTDASGAWSFGDLLAGAYTFRVESQPKYRTTTAASATVTLVKGQTAKNKVAFGEQKTA